MTTNNQDQTQDKKVEIEVDKIIDDIRKQILTQKFKETGQQGAAKLGGDYFSADFYENIYHASMSKQELRVQAQKSGVPIIGGLIDRLREMVHQVIVFYLNQFVTEQARVNQLTIGLIKEIGAEVEKLGKQAALSDKKDHNGASAAE